MNYKVKRFSFWGTWKNKKSIPEKTIEIKQPSPSPTAKKFTEEMWKKLEKNPDYKEIYNLFQNTNFKKAYEEMEKSGLWDQVPFFITGCFPRWFREDEAWMVILLDTWKENVILWDPEKDVLRLFLNDKEVKYEKKRLKELARENYTFKNPVVKKFTDVFIKEF